MSNGTINPTLTERLNEPEESIVEIPGRARFTFDSPQTEFPAPRKVRSGWISDVHLGTRGSNAGALLDFLRDHEFETLYIVGDLIDVWQLRRARYWPQQHNDVIQKILRKARKGTRIVYIPGNHDELLADFYGVYGNITIQPHVIHRTAEGRRLLVIHGHELDTVVQNVKWLAFAGDVGYQFLLSLNPAINFMRRRFGFGYWSLSAYVKRRVKDAVSFIGRFEEAVIKYAKSYSVDGVLCGHIHSAAMHQFDDVTYYNCGNWVETCSALVEYEDGVIELVNCHPFSAAPVASARPQPLPQPLLPINDKRSETLPVTVLEAELAALRRDLRATVPAYAARLETDLAESVAAVGAAKGSETLSRGRLNQIHELMIMVQKRKLKPEKGVAKTCAKSMRSSATCIRSRIRKHPRAVPHEAALSPEIGNAGDAYGDDAAGGAFR